MRFYVDHGRLMPTAALVAVAGVAWLLLEILLRQDGMQDVWRPEVLAVVLVSGFVGVGAGALGGLALRPRATLFGELKVNLEFVSIGVIAIAVPGTLMLALYTLTLTLSVVTTAFLWVIWALVVALAFVAQVLIYVSILAALIAPVFATEDVGGGCATGGCLALLIVAAVGGVAGCMGANPIHAFDFTMVYAAIDNTDWLPSWTFILDSLRAAVAWIDHVVLFATVSSVGAMLAGGLVGALLFRWVRQLLMIHPPLRPYLPGAAAPLAEGAPALHQRLLQPALIWTSILWLCLLALVLVPPALS